MGRRCVYGVMGRGGGGNITRFIVRTGRNSRDARALVVL